MMPNVMHYKGYTGQVAFSDEDSTFYGKILGINDLVTFEGSSVRTLKKAFQEAVDDYVETCQALAKEPEKSYRGQFNVRVSPKLHRLAVIQAAAAHITLNKFVEQAIQKALEEKIKLK